jgi:predicted nucleotidyltransferase
VKSLKELKDEQKNEVEHYREVADRVVRNTIQPQKGIVGVLLAGSVARGDARRGPYCLYIDLVVVAEERKDVDLTLIFGPSVEPYIPKHCVKVEDTGVALELTTTKELMEIRTRRESEIFARQEAIVLYDKTGLMRKWKESAFVISEEQIRERALHWFFRCHYLVCDYRIEKWSHRQAWLQMCQNGNEAIECYLNFLYCINDMFIPRKDWLVYLAYNLPVKAPDHEHVLERIYMSGVTGKEQIERLGRLAAVTSWMSAYCKDRKWLNEGDP